MPGQKANEYNLGMSVQSLNKDMLSELIRNAAMG